MNVINFILQYWDVAAFIFAAVVGLITLYRREGVAALKNMLFALVAEAEREYGAGTGELKKSAVIQCIYERLPKFATLVITRRTIETLLESALAYAKNKWENNPYLRDYVQGEPPTAKLEK
jgi:hypothetical protein